VYTCHSTYTCTRVTKSHKMKAGIIFIVVISFAFIAIEAAHVPQKTAKEPLFEATEPKSGEPALEAMNGGGPYGFCCDCNRHPQCIGMMLCCQD
uniref:Uncharacterized protein n=1 Tax=Amphimedon queenslandica TaxID=400682 RepID=A0A1X7UE22_AMPQE